MRNDLLRYTAETIAIENLGSDLVFKKEAGLFQDLGFSGVASSIASHVKNLLVEDDSPSGWLKAITNLLVSGALFKFHPLLGLTYGVAQALGLDLISIGKSALSGLVGAAKGVGPISLSNVEYCGKVAIAKYNSDFVKTAQMFGRRNTQKIDIPFLPSKGNSKIENVFGNLFRIGKRGKLKTLLVAILIWTLKTALLGAGIIGGAGLVSNLIKGKSSDKDKAAPEEAGKSEETEKEPLKENGNVEKPLLNPVEKPLLTPSGSGSSEFRNDSQFVWIVPIIDDIANTLALWAEDIYPELSGYKSIMYETPSFNSVVSELEQRYEPAIKGSLVMPRKYTSRKQVVDQFVDDVSQKLKPQVEGLI